MRMTSALAALLLLCAMGCGNRAAVKGVLDSAEAIMNERPDSALVLLENIDSSAVRGRATAARYSLLRSMALDKNVIDTADISIILPAVRYYERKGDDLSKARTFFYYGRVLQNGNDNEAALEAVSKAELYADRTDDLYLQGLIADCKGRIYEAEFEFEDATSSYIKALHSFQHSKALLNVKIMHERLCYIYLICDSLDIALTHAEDALMIAHQIGDTDGIINSSLCVANAYYEKEDYPSAENIILDVAGKYCDGEIPTSYYPLLSLIYLKEGNIAQARRYALAFPEKEKSGTYALLSTIEEQAKNYETSLKYHREFSDLSFKEELKIKEHSVYEADQKYKNRELLYLVDESERRVRNIVTIWILSILAAGGLSLAAIQTWRRRMTEKNTEIQEYRNKIRAMQEYSSFLEKIKDAVPEKNALIDKQIIALADMMDILVHSRENLKLTELMRFNKLMEQGKAEAPEMLEIFRNTFESRYPGVQDKLHHEFSLSRREIDLYILIIFECSASVIAYIFKTTEGYVYNRRARLRKKIGLTDERMTFENHLKGMQDRQTI